MTTQDQQDQYEMDLNASPEGFESAYLTSLEDFRRACRAEGYITGRAVAIKPSGTATSESQYTLKVHKQGCMIVEKDALRGGNADINLASGDNPDWHPYLAGALFNPWNFFTRAVVGENFITHRVKHGGREGDHGVMTVTPTKIGGITIIDLGYLHRVWDRHAADDVTRADARRNALYVRPRSWESSEEGTKVSFHLDLTGIVRSPLGGTPFCWQKITGDGLAVITTPGRRVNQRVLEPGETYEFLDINQLVGLSAGTVYRAGFNPVRSAWKSRPWFPITVRGPGLILEQQ